MKKTFIQFSLAYFYYMLQIYSDVKFPKFSFLKIFKTIENCSSTLVRQEYLRCNCTKFQLKILSVIPHMLFFPRVPIYSPILL